MKTERKLFLFILGKVLALLTLAASTAFLASVILLKMLPVGYIIAAGAVLAALVALILVLTWRGQWRARMIVGMVLAILMIAVLVTGTVFVQKALDALDEIAGGSGETIHVGIYLRSDDENDYDQMAADYQYGILQTLDRESTDKVLQQMTQTLGKTPACVEYDRLTELVDALLNKQVDAIILNQAYLVLLQEMDDYADIMESIREAVLNKVEIPDPQGPQNDPPSVHNELPESMVLYISGIDAYGSVSVRSRSDVNIIAAINTKTHQILLVSTPRDYFVPLSISDGVPDKLTHAGIYGINVSMDTLGMLYDLRIDHYFRVNFSGFERLIDALGGVTVHSDYNFSVKEHHFQKGDNFVNGKAALAFCRERYSFSAGDRQRGRNQMAMIQAVIKKAMSPALLQNYTEILKSVAGNFETSVSTELIGALVADQLKNGGAWNVVTYSVDGTGDRQPTYSMQQKLYVMQPDYKTVEKAKTMINEVLNGQTVTP